MKTFFALFLATLLTTAMARGASDEEEKSTSEKASDTWQTTKKKTKEAAHEVAQATRNAGDAVVETLSPDKDARHVEVTLSHSSIGMPSTLKPGKTAFVVKNAGKEKENFGITGEGIDREFIFALSPNDTKTLQVTLKRGRYHVYCTAKGGKKHRTEMNLRVH
jgi:hypothetical protein